MVADAEQLARLRVAIATGSLPRDVGVWALRRLLTAAERRSARNELLREAARCVDGSSWRKAHTLHRIAASTHRSPAPMLSDAPSRYVSAALELDPGAQLSVRQLLRLIGDSRGP